MATILASILLVCLIILIGFLLRLSPGKPEVFLDNDGKQLAGSISEKSFLTIGGVKQGMFIRSKNTANPVLLYVHGGPAFPNYFLFEKYKPGLEDYFTVCYWEQRGGGLSYNPKIDPESMSFEQFTADAIELSNYLRKRFGKEKIYLMAHSGGTPVAIRAVETAPQLYEAYIAMAQLTNQTESERIAFRFMLEHYTRQKNEAKQKELNKYLDQNSELLVPKFFRSMTRDKLMHELGIGTMREMKSVFRGVFIASWTCKAYTFREKLNIWNSKINFIKKGKFNSELLQLDLPSQITKLDVPVYFLSGKFDLTVNYNLSKAYLEKLEAPVKGFYTFANSAHSPLFDEPVRIREIIETDILHLKTQLADR